MRVRSWAGVVCLVSFFLGQAAESEVIFNEILADISTSGSCAALGGPPIASALCGDANGDGNRDAFDDEFVELVNTSSAEEVDISGWTISDDTQVRHTFPSGTSLEPMTAIVVFGGGNPTGIFGGTEVQLASTGSLQLDELGDTVTLQDDSMVTMDTYTLVSGTTNNNQSVVRNPDITGSDTLVNHFSDAGANDVWSPGTQTDNSFFPGTCDTEIEHLDQAQELNTGLSTVASQNHWQSVTADAFGTLTRVDTSIGFGGNWSLNIYEGVGTGGVQLYAGASDAKGGSNG